MVGIACPPLSRVFPSCSLDQGKLLGTGTEARGEHAARADALQRRAVLALGDDDAARAGVLGHPTRRQLECRADDGQHTNENQDPGVSLHRLDSTDPSTTSLDEIVVPGATRFGFVDPGKGFRDGACLVWLAVAPGPLNAR